jgi:hypothetical protein
MCQWLSVWKTSHDGEQEGVRVYRLTKGGSSAFSV